MTDQTGADSPVLWLDAIGTDDHDTVGGKGASLGEMTAAGLPVPPAFVVTAETYRSFIEETGIDEELFPAVDVDVEDSSALAEAEARAEELVLETEMPADLREDVLSAYDELGDGTEVSVAVRSSATLEDLEGASFAGQQETFLNVGSEDLVDRVKRCWASLFTQRAIYYREEQGFGHDEVDIAVVVQRMVDADTSGVLFTSHPSTGESRMIIEAAWGLGEAVVSGAVSPDNYVVDRETGDLIEEMIADKKVMHVKDPETGETVEREVPEDKRQARVVTDEEIEQLVDLGERAEAHYDAPQDIEWAIADDEVYMLQSRPITTIDSAYAADTAGAADAGDTADAADAGDTGDIADAADATDAAGATDADAADAADAGDVTNTAGAADAADAVDQASTADGADAADGANAADGADGRTVGTQGERTDGDTRAAPTTDGSGVRVEQDDDTGEGSALLKGLGASPGVVSGPVRIVQNLDQLDKVGDGDIIVTEMTTPDMVPAMKRASAIVTDEGGMTSHAAIVSRELGVPAVVGTGSATTTLSDGQHVTLDGEKGTIAEGTTDEEEQLTEEERIEEVRPQSPVKPMTATEVKVNVSIPEAAERAAATGADGVGLLRIEHMILSTGETPEHYIENHGVDAYVEEIVSGVRTVADEFYPRPVRVRTLDAPTDEFRQLEGGENEPVEHNPMLGYRGIRRSLDRPEVFEHELEAFRRLYEMSYDNVEIMFPLVNDLEDVLGARRLLEEVGIDPVRRTWGVMIETPASVLCVDDMADAGIDFASFGTNDLTQYTLAVDRNNENVADRFDELHPAVLEQIEDVIETCREQDVRTSICGQAGSKTRMVRFLVNEGVSSISANIDAVRDVQHEVKRVEQKLLLDSVR